MGSAAARAATGGALAHGGSNGRMTRETQVIVAGEVHERPSVDDRVYAVAGLDKRSERAAPACEVPPIEVRQRLLKRSGLPFHGPPSTVQVRPAAGPAVAP